MKVALRSAALAAALTLLTGLAFEPAKAAVIDFGGLPGGNGAVFTGPYVEDGYSVSAIGGTVFGGQVFGNPVPSLVVGPFFGGGVNGDIKVTFGGSAFTLTSFDLFGFGGTGSYLVAGTLGGNAVFSSSNSFGPGFWLTVAGLSGSIDELIIRMTSPSVSNGSINLDNIVVNPASVPLPAALPLFATILAGGGLIAWRRKRKAAKVATN